MKLSLFSLVVLCLIAPAAWAADGMIDVPSAHSVEKTADRFEAVLEKKGMTQFARIEHSQAAGKVDVELRETTLILFGNPKVGSPLMKCEQSMAIDLPQKALIWKDAQNNVWISYNDPGYLAKRHGMKGCDKVLGKVKTALERMTGAAAALY